MHNVRRGLGVAIDGITKDAVSKATIRLDRPSTEMRREFIIMDDFRKEIKGINKEAESNRLGKRGLNHTILAFSNLLFEGTAHDRSPSALETDGFEWKDGSK